MYNNKFTVLHLTQRKNPLNTITRHARQGVFQAKAMY